METDVTVEFTTNGIREFSNIIKINYFNNFVILEGIGTPVVAIFPREMVKCAYFTEHCTSD